MGGTTTPPPAAGIAWPVPDAACLARARQAVGVLTPETYRRRPLMISVAGSADRTPCGIGIDPAAPAGQHVSVLATTQGDGRVPWTRASPAR